MRVKKRDAGLFRLEGTKEGRKGFLSIDAEIFEVTPDFHLVELKKASGDTMEYQNILKDDITPVFEDIVWIGQDDQRQDLEPRDQQELLPPLEHEQQQQQTTTGP